MEDTEDVHETDFTTAPAGFSGLAWSLNATEDGKKDKVVSEHVLRTELTHSKVPKSTGGAVPTHIRLATLQLLHCWRMSLRLGLGAH